MSFPKYPEYKDSGVEWLGEVPAHWEVLPLKRHCDVMPSSVDKKSSEEEQSVLLCNYTDVYYNDEIIQEMDFMKATASAGQIEKFSLQKDDIIFTKDSESSDDIAIAAHVPKKPTGIVCGYHLSIARPFFSLNGRFLKRYFDSHSAKAYFRVTANGLTRVGLSQYASDNLPIPIPPKTEQATIAAFLDHETARIDALIAEQQRLINLLKEKRQAVISHAVTKGLDPDVPMKDSGVEWLGAIPRHWRLAPLKYLVDEKVAGPYGASLTKSMYTSSGYRVYGQQQVIPNDFSRGDYYISEDKFNEMRRYEVFSGDILVSVMGTVGRVAVVPEDVEPGIINPRLIRYKVYLDRVAPEFAKLLIMSRPYQDRLQEASQGSTMEGLNMSILGDLPVVLPEIKAQQEIVTHLKSKCSNLDELIKQAKHASQLLSERRSALISAAVTGKIDVRSWQPPPHATSTSEHTPNMETV